MVSSTMAKHDLDLRHGFKHSYPEAVPIDRKVLLYLPTALGDAFVGRKRREVVGMAGGAILERDASARKE